MDDAVSGTNHAIPMVVARIPVEPVVAALPSKALRRRVEVGQGRDYFERQRRWNGVKIWCEFSIVFIPLPSHTALLFHGIPRVERVAGTLCGKGKEGGKKREKKFG